MKKYNNYVRRSLALLLALVMCMGLLGTTALADETDPVDGAAVIETPAETPVDETPVVETPAETPVDETLVVETPVVETPVVETPVDETPIATLIGEDNDPACGHDECACDTCTGSDDCGCECCKVDDGNTEPGSLKVKMNVEGAPYDLVYQFAIGKFASEDLNDPESFQGYVDAKGNIVPPERIEDIPFLTLKNGKSLTVNGLVPGTYAMAVYPEGIDIKGYDVTLPGGEDGTMFVTVRSTDTTVATLNIVYTSNGEEPINPETSGPETSSPETSGPETSGPETSGPETSGPETSGPETSGPEISVTKKVVGGGNAAKNKQYTIVVKDSKGKVVGKVVLKDGETKTVKLPKAGKYTITEQNASISGYKWTHTISKKTGPETSGPETSGPETSGPETSGSGFSLTVKGGESVIVTNRYTKSGGTKEPVVHPQETVPIPPVEEIPDEELPLVELPDEEPPLVELPDEEPPLVELPDEEPPLAPAEPEVTISDDDVPLAAVPKTGDESAVWFYLAILSASALLCLAVVDWKKSKKN